MDPRAPTKILVVVFRPVHEGVLAPSEEHGGDMVHNTEERGSCLGPAHCARLFLLLAHTAEDGNTNEQKIKTSDLHVDCKDSLMKKTAFELRLEKIFCTNIMTYNYL